MVGDGTQCVLCVPHHPDQGTVCRLPMRSGGCLGKGLSRIGRQCDLGEGWAMVYRCDGDPSNVGVAGVGIERTRVEAVGVGGVLHPRSVRGWFPLRQHRLWQVGYPGEGGRQPWQQWSCGQVATVSRGCRVGGSR